MRRSNDRLRASARQHPLRALLALAALLIACAVPAQAQDPAGPTQQDPWVSIQPADPAAAPLTLPWSRLVEHISRQPFSVPDRGNMDRSVIASVSLRTIVELLGLELKSFNDVAVPRAGDRELVISGESLMQNVMTAGVIQDTDGSLKLVRSATSDDATILVVPSADHVLRLQLRQEPDVAALPTTVYEGGTIRFEATVPLGYDPAQLTYEWYINDAAGTRFTTTEPVVERTFKRAGSFNITLTYLQNGRAIPAGDGLTSFQVVSRRKADDGWAPEEERPARPGGNGKGTRNVPNDDAPDDAPEQEPTTPVTTDDGSSSGYTPPASTYTPPAAAATPPATPPTPEPPPVRRARRAPQRRAAEPELPQGETVDGYLLASATGVPVVPAAVTPADQQLMRAARAPTENGALHLPTGVWVAVGLLALVVLGWGLESRTTLPYFRP